MTVNFDYEFLDEKGKKIKFKGVEGCIFKDVAVEALLYAKSGESEPTAKEKRIRFDLAVKIKNFGSGAVMMPEDIDLIGRCLNGFHTLIAGPAMYLLEGKEIPKFN